MSKNPLILKIAAPYARALYDYAAKKQKLSNVANDMRSLLNLFDKSKDLLLCLKNPLLTHEQKQGILNKTVKQRFNRHTFAFLTLLVKRNRINLLDSIAFMYLELFYNAADVIMLDVESAIPFTNLQRNRLIRRVKGGRRKREVRIMITVKPDLIGGFLIKTRSKIIDFTIKNRVKKLSKYLDSIFDI